MAHILLRQGGGGGHRHDSPSLVQEVMVIFFLVKKCLLFTSHLFSNRPERYRALFSHPGSSTENT